MKTAALSLGVSHTYSSLTSLPGYHIASRSHSREPKVCEEVRKHTGHSIENCRFDSLSLSLSHIHPTMYSTLSSLTPPLSQTHPLCHFLPLLSVTHLSPLGCDTPCNQTALHRLCFSAHHTRAACAHAIGPSYPPNHRPPQAHQHAYPHHLHWE